MRTERKRCSTQQDASMQNEALHRSHNNAPPAFAVRLKPSMRRQAAADAAQALRGVLVARATSALLRGQAKRVRPRFLLARTVEAEAYEA